MDITMPRYFFRKSTDIEGQLPIANGGTGRSTAQAAINDLTDAASATNGHVLTKDAATGNAKFKAKITATTHDATTSWGAASGGFYTITVTTHDIATPLAVEAWELSGTDYVTTAKPDRLLIAANGNVQLRVTEDPDNRYAGRIVVM
jgi:hypothetical protein